MDEMFSRLIGVLTLEGFDRLQKARVAIIGLGGVGGIAAETIVRNGVSSILLIDKDRVDISNLNRQILFTNSDIGSEKVIVACQRFQRINPEANIKTESVKLTNETLYLIDEFKPDFIIDAIDDIKGKTLLIDYAIKHDIAIISSLGMGNRFDPSKVVITNLNDTSHDPLAKSLRYELRKLEIDPTNVKVVFSNEVPLIKSRPVSSYMGVTSTAGLLLAHHVIATIVNKETNHGT